MDTLKPSGLKMNYANPRLVDVSYGTITDAQGLSCMVLRLGER